MVWDESEDPAYSERLFTHVYSKRLPVQIEKEADYSNVLSIKHGVT